MYEDAGPIATRKKMCGRFHAVKPIVVSSLIAISIIGALGLYFTILVDLQNLEVQQHRLLPDASIFDERVSPLDVFEGTQQLKKISSESEVRDLLSKIRYRDHYVGYNNLVYAEWGGGSVHTFPVPTDSRAQLQSRITDVPRDWNSDFGSSTTSSWTAAREGLAHTEQADPAYSSTNVQVVGIDEPDHIKTDGRYVYVLNDSALVIIDAYPPESAKIVSRTTIDVQYQDLHDMFLSDDRIVVFYNSPNHEKRISGVSDATQIGSTITHMAIIDISDRKSPEIIKGYEVDGEFHDARMIGEYVYLVSTAKADPDSLVMPRITAYGSSETVFKPDMFYFDNFEHTYQFSTITAINVSDESFVNAKTFLIGPTDTVYVSHDGLYIAYKRNLSPAYYDSIKKDRFFNVIVPMLPISVQDKIKEVQSDPSIGSSEKHALVVGVLEDTYDSMGFMDKKTLFAEIGELLASYDSGVRQELENTVIHKIGIHDGAIEYKAQGGVPGLLLNQFSMDRYGNSLRAVTTYENYEGDGGIVRYNAVHVMGDEHLDVTGTLGGIAPNESVFAARFIGDRLYLVTFERIDPFFVIDLSSETPKILGELKMPGFSNYLHPYGKDHIVGIGRNADSVGIQQPGVKIALFDVSEVENPSIIDDIIIGDSRWAYSEALDDHRAFFLDTNKAIMSIPIYDRTGSPHEPYDDLQGAWNGFYVYGLDPDEGFELQGKIRHSEFKSMDYRTGYRSFYIGDSLYTSSPSTIKINGLGSMDEINSIRLGSASG